MYINISREGLMLTLVILVVVSGGIWLFTAGPIGQINHDRDRLETAVAKGDYQYFVANIETHANRSYIPLYDIDSTHVSYDRGIGILVQAFIQAHPEFQVVSWSIDRFDGRGGSVIHGIWIDHLPAK